MSDWPSWKEAIERFMSPDPDALHSPFEEPVVLPIEAEIDLRTFSEVWVYPCDARLFLRARTMETNASRVALFCMERGVGRWTLSLEVAW